MSRRDPIRPKPSGPLQQRRKLQVAVAVGAGKRRASGGVLLHEIGDDSVSELPLEIEDVVRDAEAGSNPPGIVQIIERAAAPKRSAVAVIVELHRQTDDVMTLLGEQSRSD